MRTLVCFGDSNTYGLVPAPFPWRRSRLPADVRWCGVLRKELGPEWIVVEEGLPGRTVATDGPGDAAHLNGRTFLRTILESHAPIDAMTVMLGTNDLQAKLGLSPEDIVSGMAGILADIQRSGAGPDGAPPSVILVVPAPIQAIGFRAPGYEGAHDKSVKLPGLYRQLARDFRVVFVDAADHVGVSDVDGIHLGATDHLALAAAVRRALAVAVGPTP